jgi:UDP-glucuronate 4-epimerase
MTTTLITGGAGFIGSHLADALLARGERVVCLDNFDPYYDPARKRGHIAGQVTQPNYRLIEGDICNRELVLRLFDEHRFERVAHLAALAGVRASVEEATRYTQVNVVGSINLLDGARQFGTAHFVQASTSSIYGDTDRVPFLEDQATDRPLAPYPATKKACEVMAYAYHNLFGQSITVLRFFTVYGPRVRPDMMAYQVMDSIVNDREITLFDPSNMQRDWTYVDDIISGVAAALDKPLGFEVVNIGRGEPVRLSDFVDIIEGLTGKKARLKIRPAPPSEPHVTYANIDKAQRLLDYHPQTSIRQGLSRTWGWYQSLGLTQPNRAG